MGTDRKKVVKRILKSVRISGIMGLMLRAIGRSLKVVGQVR